MSESVLLVVDVQRDVMAESINSDTVISNISGLVERARAADVPVVWVRHSADELVAGSDGWQIVSELTPAEGESIIEKTYGDAFVATDLGDVLHQLGTSRIYLCGAQSDACIRSTFYGGIYRGYNVTLIADAHTTGDLQQWGAPMSAEQSIGMLNMHAAHTQQEHVRGDTQQADEVFV